jgi:hypothetical protein
MGQMHSNFFVFFRMVLLSALVSSFVPPSLAGIRPSFWLDYSSWYATEIVLVEVTSRPAVFRVLESWKGDLEVGSTVAVPELQPVAGAIEIAAYPTEFEEISRGGRNEQIPAHHDGSRMILFLKKAADASNDQWQGADDFGEMKTSVVWIEDGQLYCFKQVVNPGPSLLVPWDAGLDKMKDRIREIRRIQLELLKVISIQDPAARAEGLKVNVHSDISEAQQLALDELGKCGPKALTTIREMLADPAFADEGAELVKAFASAGGESVGEELDGRLQEQLRFWQATAPTLPVGWWNQDATPHAPLREKYMQTRELVLALEHLHYRPALITAEVLSNFWRSLPQLNDASGLNEIISECDKLVAEMQAN